MTSMGESDVILTCNKPTEKTVSTVMSWRDNRRAHLASKQSKAGLQGEAQSRLHGGADGRSGVGGGGRTCMDRACRHLVKF